eukprot:4478517-Pleurochrysis_carterae.AAC.1
MFDHKSDPDAQEVLAHIADVCKPMADVSPVVQLESDLLFRFQVAMHEDFAFDDISKCFEMSESDGFRRLRISFGTAV